MESGQTKSPKPCGRKGIPESVCRRHYPYSVPCGHASGNTGGHAGGNAGGIPPPRHRRRRARAGAPGASGAHRPPVPYGPFGSGPGDVGAAAVRRRAAAGGGPRPTSSAGAISWADRPIGAVTDGLRTGPPPVRRTGYGAPLTSHTSARRPSAPRFAGKHRQSSGTCNRSGPSLHLRHEIPRQCRASGQIRNTLRSKKGNAILGSHRSGGIPGEGIRDESPGSARPRQ